MRYGTSRRLPSNGIDKSTELLGGFCLQNGLFDNFLQLVGKHDVIAKEKSNVKIVFTLAFTHATNANAI